MALHGLQSMGFSPRAQEGGGGRWKGTCNGRASSLTFGIDGERLQSSSNFGSPSGGGGGDGVSYSSVTSWTRSGHGEKVWRRAARVRAQRQWEKWVRVAGKVHFKGAWWGTDKRKVSAASNHMCNHGFVGFQNKLLFLFYYVLFSALIPSLNRRPMGGRCSASCGARSRRGRVEVWRGVGTSWHGQLIGPMQWTGEGTSQGVFRPKWLMEKGNWYSYFWFHFKWILFRFKQFLNGFEN
jgi:hypothetical protein